MRNGSREKSTTHHVGQLLRQRIAAGQYRVGERLPTIEQLNSEFFGSTAGPKNARDVYASLISEGMVEARVGRAGGHFLVSTAPMPSHEYLDDTAADIAGLLHHAGRLAQREVYVVDIRKVRSQKPFSECFQPTRLAAKQFATSILCALGEPKPLVTRAVGTAGRTAVLTRPEGYHLRIYSRRLGEQIKHTEDRNAAELLPRTWATAAVPT